MPELKSVTAGGKDWAKDVATKSYTDFARLFPRKLYWFVSNGYRPHEWQAAFHAAHDEDQLVRFRHLVAGRRGGKTMSAAWETLYYALHPEEFHRDAHGTESQRPLWIWVLAKDHEVGFPARQAMQEALDAANLRPNTDYKWNRTEKKIEFENGTLLQFKSADDPQSLRGAGLDILWIDEAAFVPSRDAWDVVRPALSDKLGRVITTTTPKGTNWFYDEFWSPERKQAANQFRVEYTSIDNPYFAKEEWEEAKATLHPIIFAQEFMAAFDALQGIDLHGDWLHYFVIGDPEPGSGDIRVPQTDDKKLALRRFIGVDLASSLRDTADHFAMACIGITDDNANAFVLDTFKGRLDFPDQLDKVREWFLTHRPEYIGIESNAYQAMFERQASRMEGMPPTVPVLSRSKKTERILTMAPMFKIGKVRIHRRHADFVDEWVNYDSTLKNPKDDLLDATEIALSAAGVLLPIMQPSVNNGPRTINEEAWAQIRAHLDGADRPYDPDLGSEA